MCGIVGSIVTVVVGAVLVVGSCVISFVFVPQVVESIIKNEVVLINNTIQMERFETQPFPVNFTIRIFNISNPEEVMNGGVPVLKEIGPYVYRLFQTREVLGMDEDTIRYVRHERFEFDPVASYPNTEADMATIVNVPYHAIIQVAASFFPNLMSVLNVAMAGVFGQYNTPIATFNVRDLFFDGIPICRNPGLIAGVACGVIREIAARAQNIEELEDGSLSFSVLGYKEMYPSQEYVVRRGLNDSADLGRIVTYANSPYFPYWTNDTHGYVSVCNMINGTDAGIFAPFVDRNRHIYAINTDICRSVELRYESDDEYEGIPTTRFSANEWLLDNDEGCYCLNVTSGVNRENGCLLRGAMELYSCVGAFLVMSYPHFLFADPRYRDGVIGMRPDEENHKIFIEVEPNTGTPIRGAKRAQFNIFMRTISQIPPTRNLRTSLVPFLWVEESVALPEEFIRELTSRLLNNLRLVDIFLPILIALCCVVLVVGVGLTVRAKSRKPNKTLMSTGPVVEN